MCRMILCVTGTLLLIILPQLATAQDVSDDIHSLQSVLDRIYNEMIPMCGKLINVGRAIAGFAALWYIAARVWKSIATAQPVDFYPLFRPFCLCLVISFFTYVIAIIDGVLSPTVSGTAAMVKDSEKAIQMLLAEKEKAIRESDTWKSLVGESGEGDRDLWLKYAHPEQSTDGEAWYERISNNIQFSLSKGYYKFKNQVKQFFAEVLQILYEAAALCINTIRTFIRIVLAVIGPLVCAIAVFDGFQHTLVVWLARYINVYLWLPISNIFGSITGKIMEHMIKIDIEQINLTGDTFFSSADIGYLVFMIIAIIGYMTIPNVANMIVSVGDRTALSDKVTSMFGGATSYVAGGATGMLRDQFVDARQATNSTFSGGGFSGGYFPNGSASDYQRSKLNG
ncbi:conjugative transposon protein TraJ [Chitinophaga tropicalis]|uniref:Conjugative transposon protein TraJ n=1 Tax=Chitinophaga tropicalis TaxID=2683588 RepID=A0A7K1U010_9BACT|nr:conjugative transposon protein TraJ [Chitinophaga tropicalis]MVT07698.1 conjugative transposon protein TraJ [Chitinophaga tropicalis]